MNIDRKNILLFMPTESTKYVPIFDYEGLGYTEDDREYIAQNFYKPEFDREKYPLVYRWDLETSFQEKKLRTLDCFGADGYGISGRAFFVHDRLLECWFDLVKKDLQVISTKCYTKKGLVTEFHLVDIINEVDGLDPHLTCDVRKKNDMGGRLLLREVPKASNDFMNGSQIARDRTWWLSSKFYITPELVEKTLKYLHKKELKTAYIMTFKEEWEWLYGGYADCPPYSADYTNTENKKSS